MKSDILERLERRALSRRALVSLGAVASSVAMFMYVSGGSDCKQTVDTEGQPMYLKSPQGDTVPLLSSDNRTWKTPNEPVDAITIKAYEGVTGYDLFLARDKEILVTDSSSLTSNDQGAFTGDITIDGTNMRLSYDKDSQKMTVTWCSSTR